jgi:ATP-dependent RNA circularization protein (DNA/RNA ligase family)
MNREIKFLIYCIEEYKSNKNMTGKDAMTLFEKYGVVDYIIDCYEALHTTGEQYIIHDIDAYIKYKSA